MAARRWHAEQAAVAGSTRSMTRERFRAVSVDAAQVTANR
jgi:hypothetical protein